MLEKSGMDGVTISTKRLVNIQIFPRHHSSPPREERSCVPHDSVADQGGTNPEGGGHGRKVVQNHIL
jgi:hypothetical protein